MEPCLGVGARLEQLGQGLSRLRVAAMKKQPLGGVARPATRAVERGDELRGVPVIEIGDWPWIFTVTINPVNPAAIRTGTEVDEGNTPEPRKEEPEETTPPTSPSKT